MRRLVVMVAVLGAGLLPADASAQNLLTNAGFDASIDGWEESNSSVVLAHREGEGSRLPDGSGPGAIEVRFPASTNGGGAKQRVAGRPDTDYVVAASVKLPEGPNGAESLSLWVYFYDGGGSYIAYEQVRGDEGLVGTWQRLTIVVRSPPGTGFVEVMLGAFNYDDDPPEGFLYWDDALLAEEDAGSSVQSAFLVAAADTPGLQGTYWTTEAWIANTTDEILTLEAAFLGQDGDNAADVAAAREVATIPPRGMAVLGDLVARAGGSGSGGMYLRATAPGLGHRQPLMRVCSYTSTPAVVTDGAYGQGIPGLVGGTPDGIVAVAAGAFQDTRRRTNVGVLNTSRSPITVDVEVLDAGGAVRATSRWSLAPYQHRQRSLRSLGVDLLDGGSVAFVSETPGMTFGGYLSVVDEETGDAVFVAAQ